MNPPEPAVVTGWSNGKPADTGAGYGLRLLKKDRDRLIQRSWDTVTVELPDGSFATARVDGASFWKDCSELRSKDIGRWLLNAGHAPWPKGHPPRFALVPAEDARFLVREIKSPATTDANAKPEGTLADDSGLNHETNDELADTAKQIFDAAQKYWIEPEVERRQAAGLLPTDRKVRLEAVEILARISPTKDRSEEVQVRLNHEVRALVRVRGTRVSLPLWGYCGGWHNVEDVHLDEADADCSFVVIFVTDGGIVVKADRRFRGRLVTQMAALSAEYLASAEDNLKAGRLRPFSENLFAAVEQAAKAMLFWVDRTRYWDSSKHSAVKAEINRAASKDEVPREYASLYNRLSGLRKPARYAEGELDLTDTEANQLLATAQRMHDEIVDSVPDVLMDPGALPTSRRKSSAGESA